MQRLASSGKAESFCVDGDIKRVAGGMNEAVLAYLNAHIVDSQYTMVHLESLSPAQKDEITTVLQDWLKTDEDSRTSRKKQGVKATPDQMWNFIFHLQPEAVTTCFARIEPMMKEQRYQQVIDSCSAILHHYPNDTAPILLQRALAYTLIGNHGKHAISDYLRAFIKDKDATIQVTRSKHGQHLPKITQLLRDCVFSPQPTGSLESKPAKQWLQLTLDCCKLLLTLDPNNFLLQMTYAERMKMCSRLDKAVAVLNESLGVLKLDLEPDSLKLTEALLRRGICYHNKHQTDMAVQDITAGLNAVTDKMISLNRADDYGTAKQTKTSQKHEGDKDASFDVTTTFLKDSGDTKISRTLASEILGGPSGNMSEICTMLEKAAAKLNPSDKFSGVLKLESVRQASELYRALLVMKPRNRDILIKLSICYSKLGRHSYAIKIYDFLLADKRNAQDNTILSARAACYRELGNKVEARKDYDALLSGNPQDASLLFERALVHMENSDINSLVTDMQIACKSNMRTVSMCMNKLPLAQRTRIRQILFEHAKLLLQEAHMPEYGDQSSVDKSSESAGLKSLSIAQLLTKLNSVDYAAHIVKAHALFFVGSFNDAELSLKRLLQENPQNPDSHMIKLHLGLLRIFTRHTDEGMTLLVEVLTAKGERVVSNLLRDIPVSERAKLSDECHQYAIDIIQKRRDPDVVRQAAHCFTIAILCCRGTDLILEGLNGGTGVCRSYLARAECMAHLGDQRSAVLDFSAALEVNPGCVEGLCGRAFMRLALGDEHECVEDMISACELDMFTTTAHIKVLPEEAKKLLLFWLDHRVVALLLNYGQRTGSNERISTGGSASTISVMDETALKPGHESSLNSSLSSIQPPSPSDSEMAGHIASNGPGVKKANGKSPSLGNNAHNLMESTKVNVASSINTSGEMVSEVNGHRTQTEGNPTPVVVDVHLDPVSDNDVAETVPLQNQQHPTTKTIPESDPTKRRFHKSSASSRNFKDVLLGIDKAYDDKDGVVKTSIQNQPHGSRESTAATNTSSLFTYDDVISGMERTEILHKAQLLGKLLITVDQFNSTWHGMYADILIVKGDFDEALRHLQVVMKLTPADVTGIARAGLINVKQNRYKQAANLLSVLAEVDKNGLVYVLRALDPQKRGRLSEEAFRQAETLCAEEKFNKAVEYYGLSLHADSDKRIEKLRMRARCFTKLRDMKRAAEDMSTVIRDSNKTPKAGDYCLRAHILLLDNKEKEACNDYIKALQIDRDQSSLQIHAKPGRNTLSRVFYRQALDAYGQHGYQDCSDMCDYGLMIDDSNVDLRKLRARAKREISKCSIQ